MPRKTFDFFDMLPSTVSIQRPAVTQSAQGAMVRSHAPVAGLQDLACSLQPLGGTRQEVLAQQGITATHHAIFAAELPLANGDLLIRSGVSYVVQAWALQGDGGADGADVVFVVYLQQKVA